jgi:hypothetical protein
LKLSTGYQQLNSKNQTRKNVFFWEFSNGIKMMGHRVQGFPVLGKSGAKNGMNLSGARS